MSVLVYDGDCGFCETCARWIAQRLVPSTRVVPWQSLPDLEQYGLTLQDVATAAHWIDVDDRGRASRSLRGHLCVAEALKHTRSRRLRAVGIVMGSAPSRPFARLLYELVARIRHRLPGSTAACKVPTALPVNPEHPPRWARPFVYGVLALLITSVALSVESWPLTSFKLFSRTRGPEQLSWSVVTVDSRGTEHAVDWGSLPSGLKGWHSTAGRLARMDESRRVRVLRSWADAAGHNDTVAIRVYRVVQRIPIERGAERVVLARTLRYELQVERQ